VAGYLLRRLAQAAPLVLAILILTFVLIHLAPGDPIYALAGQSGDAAYYASMRARFGLDRPLGEQLLIYLWNAAHGDFGYSYTHSQPVLQVIGERVPATLVLMLSAFILSALLGVGLGVVAVRNYQRAPDHAITVGSLIGAALPAFWLGQVLVIVFAGGLGWFPVQGMTTARSTATGLDYLLDVLRHLVLPVATLTILQLTLITRLTRSGLLEGMAEEYVRTARAKGIPEPRVIARHVLPNALLPVVTLLGSHFGTLLTGAVLTEIIFAWPGLGRLLYDATLARDYPLLMGVFLVAAVSVILANLLTDLTYGLLDPRVRLR
jgi:peptide/nickel transport system permease protein